jgi:hypothetical protein
MFGCGYAALGLRKKKKQAGLPLIEKRTSSLSRLIGFYRKPNSFSACLK